MEPANRGGLWRVHVLEFVYLSTLESKGEIPGWRKIFKLLAARHAVFSLPRFQTSLFFSRNKSARKARREGEKARDVASPRRFLSLPWSFALRSRYQFALFLTSPLLGRSKHLRRRQVFSKVLAASKTNLLVLAKFLQLLACLNFCY